MEVENYDGLKVRYRTCFRSGLNFYDKNKKHVAGPFQPLQVWLKITGRERGITAITECRITTPEGIELYGYSFCTDMDTYSKKVGQKKALGQAMRLLKKLRVASSAELPVQEAGFTFLQEFPKPLKLHYLERPRL